MLFRSRVLHQRMTNRDYTDKFALAFISIMEYVHQLTCVGVTGAVSLMFAAQVRLLQGTLVTKATYSHFRYIGIFKDAQAFHYLLKVHQTFSAYRPLNAGYLKKYEA